MLKPKSSAVISTWKEFNKIPKANWSSNGGPYSPLFYIYKRTNERLFCYIVAKDNYGDFKVLPYKCGEKDVRIGLKELKIK